jgi:uncharacterized protein (TIGR03083 family)
MSQFAPEDAARHYENAHLRIVELVRSLSEEQAATPVPAAPGWDVHDVLAHLAANTTDGIAGRISGIPDDAFTGEQVRQRKAATIEELVAEWQGNMPTMLDAARAGLAPPPLAADALTHEQDIRGALALDRVDDRAALRFSLELFALGLAFRLKDNDNLALRLEATDGDFTVGAGAGEPAVTLRASEFELFRMLAGRRGRAAVLAMDWDGDATAFLPWLNNFGALPHYDITD